MAYIPDQWVIGRLPVAESARGILFYYCLRADQDTGRTNVSPERTSQDLGIRKDHVNEHDRTLVREGLIVITKDDNGGRVIQMCNPWLPRSERQNGSSQVLGGHTRRRKRLKTVRKRTSQDLGESTQDLGETTQNLGESTQNLGEVTQDLGKSTQNLGGHIGITSPCNQPNNQPNNHGREDAPDEEITKERCYDLFVKNWGPLGGYEAPYDSKKDADFSQLARLIKFCRGKNWPLTEKRFLHALTNYFATPQSCHTIADLASRFSYFYKTPYDRFTKPRDAPTKQSLSERNRAAAQEAMRRRGITPASTNVIDIKAKKL